MLKYFDFIIKLFWDHPRDLENQIIVYMSFKYINKQMHLSEPNYELTPEQITIRDTAQLYLKIEENTQFLTNLVRHQVGRQRPVFNIEIQQVQIKSFFNVIVQASYLMYTCTIRKVALFLSREVYVHAYRDSSPEIILEFLLQKQLLNMPEEKQRYLEKSFHYINPYKHQNAYANNLLSFIKNIIEILKAYINKHKDKKILGDKVIMRQIQAFIQVIALLEPEITRGIKPKTLISCLEQTQLFRVHSALLKTLNSSMYQNLRKTGKLKQIISDIKRQQIRFNEHLNSLRMDNKFLQQEPQMIEGQVENFLAFLQKMKLIAYDSANNSDQNNPTSQKIVEVLKDGSKIIKYKIKVQSKMFRQFTRQLLNQIETGVGDPKETISESQEKKYNYFQIDLHPYRRFLCVKYISDVEIAIQNMDILMYHCNNMMMGWQNASMEQIQSKKKKKEKLLAFKIISQFHSKESPFLNILLGIDMALIYGKVSEPELTQKVIRIDDNARFAQTGKKIDHLMSLFIKKIKRLYESIAQKVS